MVAAGDGFAADCAGFFRYFESIGFPGDRGAETILARFDCCLGDGEGGLAIVPLHAGRQASTAKDKLLNEILVDRQHVKIFFIISILSC
jgi:hypothetical protein